jgi:hypothetical protein
MACRNHRLQAWHRGDGLTLELPGCSVDILHPPARQRVPAAQRQIELRANAMMRCGCPIEPAFLFLGTIISWHRFLWSWRRCLSDSGFTPAPAP